MTELVEHARQFIERQVEELRGEDDFMPFMTYTAHDGTVGFIGLAAMGEQAERDGLAASMTAVLTIYRATEALFATCAYMVRVQTREEMKGLTPSQHPNREERVFMHHVDPEGVDRFHSAKIHRIKDRVALGAWETEYGEDTAMKDVGGRFGDAIHMGLTMGSQLPPEMIAFIDAHIEENSDQMVSTFVKVISQLRGGEPLPDFQFLQV